MSVGDGVSDSVRSLGNLVEALEAETEKVRTEAMNRLNTQTEFKIQKELGSVTVDGSAQLREIHLNSKRIYSCDPETLAASIVAAVNAAEEEMRSRIAKEAKR